MAEINMQVIVTAVKAGAAVLLGEYRGGKADNIKWVDKTSGQAKSMVKCSHVVETGDGKTFESVTVDEMLPDGTDPEKWVPPFKRGDMVLVSVRKLESNYGKREVSASGIAKIG